MVPRGRTVGRTNGEDFCGFGTGGITIRPTASHAGARDMRARSSTCFLLPTLPITSIDQIELSTNGGNPPIKGAGGMTILEGQSETSVVPLEADLLPQVGWTFDLVQERLVEAMITCWRNPDRERGWQRIRALWPEMRRHTWFGDYGEQVDGVASRELRPAALTRVEQGEMEEAFAWSLLLAPEDRKLVGMVITLLARGAREVRWRQLLKPMGLTRGADGLRMRYGRAIAAIAASLNGGNPQRIASSPKIDR